VTSYSALAPVSAGIYTLLHVAALTALATGGIGDDIAQGSGYPFVQYDVDEEDLGGLGAKSGTPGSVFDIDILVHVYSQYEGMHEAQTIMAKVIELLADPPTVAGFSSVAIFRNGKSINLGDQIVAGVKVKELIQRFRFFAVVA
jgi:hypothetical protein